MTSGEHNQVLELCDEGLTAELAGNLAEAKISFQRAWDTAENPFERCVAAHYLARHQPTDAEALDWNLRALSFADEVQNINDVSDYLPALYLNAAVGLVRAGEFDRARDLYLLAADGIEAPGVGVPTEWLFVRYGLQAAGFVPQGESMELRRLIARLHETQNSEVLAAILPAHVTNTGTDGDVAALTNALKGVLMARVLDADEQDLLRQALDAATRPEPPVAATGAVASAASTAGSEAVGANVSVSGASATAAVASVSDEEPSPDVDLRL
ncbi:hypothetical protein GOARA_033_00120 [Gordonia araii NBRC 100433]|uniref:Tetratricopeptide repeat protein n=1 Tax=Gordonia araii NBRC 100433 TaxID=1073574 RepID=G7H036_9ACTN|nr:hypothetical protein [Gordonia araii]NNG99056.1 hypothetical protein [Gordonia araii NBRC 100433]GAB09211.1 hypothetical protein GOARA_033_00120 [Gordonia araii NBRC 100433]